MAFIAASLLAADFSRLSEALAAIKGAGGTLIHVDVMDGHFLPEISVGQPVIASLRRATDLVLEIHLLIERPERYAAEFAALGAGRILVNVESTPQTHSAIQKIRGRGVKAGIAINPGTPVEAIEPLVADVDFVSILSADPVLSGEIFLPQALAKVRQADRLRSERRLSFQLEVEGGIQEQHLPALLDAGADILVLGSAIFGSITVAERFADLASAAAATRRTSIA
jgi:ribulose-phosphate 3-epimerase